MLFTAKMYGGIIDMTRFDRELKGEFGDYWKKEAIKFLHKIEEEVFTGKITIDAQGVARNCIGRVVMDDVANALDYIIQDGSFRWDKTIEARNKENEAFLKEYASREHHYSDEEIAEMKAAFGEGTKVVNILTGKEIQL